MKSAAVVAFFSSLGFCQGVTLDRPVERHHSEDNSKEIEAAAVDIGSQAQAAATLESEMNDLLDMPLSNAREERHRLAARSRSASVRAMEARQQGAAEQKQKSLKVDAERRVKATEIAERRAAEQAVVDQRHAEAAERKAQGRFETMQREKAQARRRAEAREMEKEALRQAVETHSKEVALKKHASELEENAAKLAREEAKELEILRMRETKAQREKAEMEEQKRKEAKLAEAAKALAEAEERQKNRASSKEERMARVETVLRKRKEGAVGRRIATRANQELREAKLMGTAILGTRESLKKKHEAHEVMVGDLSLADLIALAGEFVDPVHNPLLIGTIENETAALQDHLGEYVHAIKIQLASMVQNSKNASNHDFIVALSSFGENLVKLMKNHATHSPQILKSITDHLPARTSHALMPLTMLLTPPDMTYGLNGIDFTNTSQAGACERLAKAVALFLPVQRSARAVHAIANSTVAALPVLEKATKDFTPEVSTVVEHMLSLVYMEVTAVDDITRDLVSQIGPLALTKLQCTFNSRAASRGFGGFFAAAIALMVAWISF